MSFTSEVYTNCTPGYHWIYYIATNSEEVATALANPQQYPVVLMFWASWNEPCKVMLRPFRNIAMAKRKKAVFCRVDVDKCKEIVAQYQVEALPTFLVIKQNQEKGRIVGAKVDELNNTINANI